MGNSNLRGGACRLHDRNLFFGLGNLLPLLSQKNAL